MDTLADPAAVSRPVPAATSLDDAFAYCEALTRSHYENFPVGSRLIPARIRPHVYSIYAFARTADDVADEPGLAQAERTRRLDEWDAKLASCTVAPEGPILTALAETIRSQQLPRRHLHDLLHAFKMDVVTHRHGTFNHLLSYCRYSAAPVGRLILHLFSYTDARRAYLSDLICTALQLANFWQDIAIDFSRGRIYLPRHDMDRFCVTEDDLAKGRPTDGFRALLTCEIERTRLLFQKGAELPDLVSGRLKYELRLTWLGGMRILDKIHTGGYDVFSCRPKIEKRDIPSLFLNALFRRPRACKESRFPTL
ncbi:MAG: squalene synthase HpnC [Gemmatimonadota bacterium]|nr:squalene synthase HpnC [Gemmatimonadota bacterium]